MKYTETNQEKYQCNYAIGSCYFVLVILYFISQQADYNKAIQYNNKAIQYSTTNKDKYFGKQVITTCYTSLKRYEEAISNTKDLLQLAETDDQKFNCYATIVNCYFMLVL